MKSIFLLLFYGLDMIVGFTFRKIRPGYSQHIAGCVSLIIVVECVKIETSFTSCLRHLGLEPECGNVSFRSVLLRRIDGWVDVTCIF
jgi:hypothetical protein